VLLSDLASRALGSAAGFIGLLAGGLSIIKHAEKMRQWYLRFLSRHPWQARFAWDSEWAKNKTYNTYTKYFGAWLLAMAAIALWCVISNLSELLGVK
jgi:hypothetical protein